MKPLPVRIGLVKPDEVPAEIRARLTADGETVRAGGLIYLSAGSRILCCEDSEEGEAVIRAMTEKRDSVDRREDPWRSLLQGGAKAGTVPDGILRCMIVLRAAPGQEKLPDRAALADLIPTEPGDAITAINDAVVLIKQADRQAEDEVTEFTAAVIDTAETEAGIRLQAGIGRTARNAAELKASFAEAEAAIDTGRRFLPGEAVYAYSRLAAERLMDAVPAEIRAQLRKELFTPETRKLLNSEMMETIEAFFQNDMNLSTTAREMFIHRNTLIYRLDKIRKATGFDLRRFQDAAAFRLLSRLPEDEE